jgi:hypothetical protein
MDSEDAAKSSGSLGKHDLSFDAGEPERHRKDVPTAQSRYSTQATSSLVPKPMKLRHSYAIS